MALKVLLTKGEFTALEEGLQPLYQKSGEGDKESYILEISGVEDHPALKALRTTLAKYKEIGSDPEKLKKRLDAAASLQELLGEEDPEELKTRLGKLKDFEEHPPSSKDVEAEVKRRVEAATKDHDKVLKAKEKAITDLTTQVGELTAFNEDLLIDRGLNEHLTKAKVLDVYKPAVVALMKNRKPKVLREVDESTGKASFRAVFMTDIGEQDLSVFVEAWSKTDEAEAYLPPSDNRGGGSRSDSGNPVHRGVKNPWKKDSFNLTEQGRITASNPALAKTLKAQAGVA